MARLKTRLAALALFMAFAGTAHAMQKDTGAVQTFDCYCSNSSGYCMANYDPNTPTHFSCEPQSRPGQTACTGNCILKETTGDGSSGGGITRKSPAFGKKGGDLPALVPAP